jgi:hypothetical protein
MSIVFRAAVWAEILYGYAHFPFGKKSKAMAIAVDVDSHVAPKKFN